MRGSFKANGRPHKRDQHNLEQREGSSENTGTDDLSDARRRPGRGDGSLRQCVSCGCAVPVSGWEQHMNGIRHRRNQASMTLMGEPGHLVRSIFEPDPTDIPETYRGKDPVALRAQQLRHLMVAADDEDGGGEQQRQQQRQQRQAPVRRQPRAEGQPTPQRHRSHSEAFAQLQARREQRLLGAAAAQPPSPPVSDSSASDSGSDTSRSEASDSGSDGEPHGGGAAGCGPSHRHRHAPSAAAQHPLPRQRQAAAAAAAEWRPDEGAVSGLVAAARRQAVHHTGLGPLYQGALGLLDAGALRRAAAGLQERLGRYRRRLDAWLLQQQQQQQQHGHGQQRQGLPPAVREGGGGNGSGGSAAGAGNEAAGVLARGFAANAGGGAGGSELSDDNGSDTSSSSSSSSSDENGSEGGWERLRGLAARAATRVAGRQQQQQQPEPQRRRRRPYLCLGPAELLLLSIHPAVAETRSCGAGSATPTASASNVEAAAAAAARQTAAGCATSRRPDLAFSRQVGHRQRWAQPATAAPRQLRPPQAPAPKAPAPLSPLRHLYLEAPFKPHGREAAAYATAMGVLLAALRRGPGGGGGSDGLEAFGLRFSREDYMQVVGQGGAARLAPLESLWQLAPALVQLMQARPGVLRELRLCCPPGLLDAGRVESLQRAAVDTSLRNQRRLAVLMGSHARLGAASPLQTLPREVLELLLDRALPRRPCRLVLGLRKWLPGHRQSRRREAAPGGPGGLAAGGADAAAAAAAAAAPEAVWAAPAAAAAGAAAAPPPPLPLQQLPLDVRVAAGHAARR